MKGTSRKPRIEFGSPARYCIVVQGTLDVRWQDRLGDLTITAQFDGDGVSQVMLSGVFADQAALNGVIEILYGLHLPIIRIEQIEDDA